MGSVKVRVPVRTGSFVLCRASADCARLRATAGEGVGARAGSSLGNSSCGLLRGVTFISSYGFFISVDDRGAESRDVVVSSSLSGDGEFE